LIWKPKGIQNFFILENKLSIQKARPHYQKILFRQTTIDSLWIDIEKYKNKLDGKKCGEFIGKLELLALNGDSKAHEILMNFESYFKFNPMASLAEELQDALNTVKWIKK
jgi:hypothetical protein